MIALLTALTLTLLTNQVPLSSSGTQAWNLGVRIVADVPGRIVAIRYYRDRTDLGPHIGQVWSLSGVKLAEVDFSNETPSGWQRQDLLDPVFLAANTPVVITVNSPVGAHYAMQPGVFPLVNGHLSALAGVYKTSGYPTDTTPTNYFRDGEFIPQMITLRSDPSSPGGFVAIVDGFQEGNYVLTVMLKGKSGVVTTESIDIVMPAVKTP